eukprot:2271286-Prorocentrum_lima.AAC.1
MRRNRIGTLNRSPGSSIWYSARCGSCASSQCEARAPQSDGGTQVTTSPQADLYSRSSKQT